MSVIRVYEFPVLRLGSHVLSAKLETILSPIEEKKYSHQNVFHFS